MTDYREIQERGYVSTLDYLKRAREWLDKCDVNWRQAGCLLAVCERSAIETCSGNSYTKVLAAFREHGGIDAAIAALEANNETE